jgi:hypothetical protein
MLSMFGRRAAAAVCRTDGVVTYYGFRRAIPPEGRGSGYLERGYLESIRRTVANAMHDSHKGCPFAQSRRGLYRAGRLMLKS